MSLLSVDNVSYWYPREERAALRNVSFTVEAGEHIALIGPNGSGKSTLFNILAAAIPLPHGDGGTVLLDGRGLRSHSVAARSRRLAFVPQSGRIEFPYTCLEIVLMGLRPHENRFAAHETAGFERAGRVMRETGVWELAGRSIRAVSGGQFQRVMLARALLQILPDFDSGLDSGAESAADSGAGAASPPGILLLDEALSELDIAARIAMMRLLSALAATRKIAVIGVHHDLSLLQRFSSRVIALSGGTVAADGTPNEVFTEAFFEKVFAVHAGIVPGKGFFFL
jgi:iron complex transport system ATP-binding protein